MHAYDTGRPSSQLLALERIVKIKFKKKGSFQTGLRLPTILFSHPWPVEGEQKWPGDNLCGTFYCFPWTAGCVNEFCCRQYCLLSAPHILKGLLRDGGGVCVYVCGGGCNKSAWWARWGGVMIPTAIPFQSKCFFTLWQKPFSSSISALFHLKPDPPHYHQHTHTHTSNTKHTRVH